jgi:hypothetical protein
LGYRLLTTEASVSNPIEKEEESKMAGVANSAMPRTANVGSTNDKRAAAPTLNAWFIPALALGFVVLIIVVAFIRSPNAAWLWETVPAGERVLEFAVVIGPFVAAALAIERLLETIFAWYEQTVRSAARVLNGKFDLLDWIGKEYKLAYEAVERSKDAFRDATLGQNTETAADRLRFEEAVSRLEVAEARLNSWVDAPEYKTFKRSATVVISFGIGIIIAMIGELTALNAIGIETPRLFDIVFTGLIIGAGPGPTHDILRLLQSAKEALSSAARRSRIRASEEATDNADVRRASVRRDNN